MTPLKPLSSFSSLSLSLCSLSAFLPPFLPAFPLCDTTAPGVAMVPRLRIIYAAHQRPPPDYKGPPAAAARTRSAPRRVDFRKTAQRPRAAPRRGRTRRRLRRRAAARKRAEMEAKRSRYMIISGTTRCQQRDVISDAVSPWCCLALSSLPYSSSEIFLALAEGAREGGGGKKKQKTDELKKIPPERSTLYTCAITGSMKFILRTETSESLSIASTSRLY